MALDNVEGGGVIPLPSVDMQDAVIPGHSSVQGLLTTALVDQQVVADDGNLYDTVQAAENAASSWIFVPPGTFNEAVVVDTAGLTVVGSGRGTLIDGQTAGSAISVEAANVTIQCLSVQTTAGQGNTVHGIESGSGGDAGIIDTVWVRGSDSRGINTQHGTDWMISFVITEACDDIAIRSQQERTITIACICKSGVGNHGVNINGDDSITAYCQCDGVGGDGITHPNANDSLVGGCRVHNSTGDGIQMTATDQILFNNRISGSGGSDINSTGSTGLVQDSNLTGAAN